MGGSRVIFSPRPDETALRFYSDLARGAKEAVFMTAAFGVSKVMAEGLLHAEEGSFKGGFDMHACQSHNIHTYLLLENKGRGKDSPQFVEAVEGLPFGSVSIGSHLEAGDLIEGLIPTQTRMRPLTSTLIGGLFQVTRRKL